jgi:hypothetical protein
MRSLHLTTAFIAIAAGASVARCEERHWSFRPVERVALPVVDGTNHVRNGIDAFVQQRLEAADLLPTDEADPVTAVRRVTLDLIGLPPTPDEVDAYLCDDRPGRYERLVERLLASPHYGERWAQPWLDLCHYADTDGYLTDQLRPVAWRYRAWLIDALNRNKPFDAFTIEQLAGDLLPSDSDEQRASDEQRIATGFLRQTLSNREGGAEPEEFRVKQIVDRTEMVGTIWLGLTVGCARCHDHKYDPLEQREFFELYACLNNADEVNIDAPLPHERREFIASRGEYHRRRRALIEPVRGEVEAIQQRWEARCLAARDNPGADHIWDRQWELLGLVWGGGLGEGQLEGQEIVKLPWPKRSPRQRDDLLDYFLRSGSIVDPHRYEELRLGELREQLQALAKELPVVTRAPVMQAALTPREAHLHEAGDFRDRGERVVPSTPDCLPAPRTDVWQEAGSDPRLALARWLVTCENPLTARVTVNRMWQHFFGRGLVVTTEDFGTRGAAPTHPQLLDWLAAEFIDSGWDVKAMHRVIVGSATYRRASTPRRELALVDPDNELLARQHSLRVSAETVRDAGLLVSGLLERRIGGPSVRPPQPATVTMEAFGTYGWQPSPAPDCFRRGVYTFVIRTTPFAQSLTFDAPNPNEICTRRVRSNTPLQALTLLNDPVFYEMARSFADRVQHASCNSDEARIEYAFRVCLARPPNTDERERLAEYLGTLKSELDRDTAWTNLCSVLVNLHEFITRD